MPVELSPYSGRPPTGWEVMERRGEVRSCCVSGQRACCWASCKEEKGGRVVAGTAAMTEAAGRVPWGGRESVSAATLCRTRRVTNSERKLGDESELALLAGTFGRREAVESG